jgi:hypothetical protein
MRMERLCLRDERGEIQVYDGNIGTIVFAGGVSVDEWDVESRVVRRLLSAEDGGLNIYPPMRIMPRKAVEKPEPPAPKAVDDGPKPVDENPRADRGGSDPRSDPVVDAGHERGKARVTGGDRRDAKQHPRSSQR